MDLKKFFCSPTIPKKIFISFLLKISGASILCYAHCTYLFSQSCFRSEHAHHSKLKIVFLQRIEASKNLKIWICLFWIYRWKLHSHIYNCCFENVDENNSVFKEHSHIPEKKYDLNGQENSRVSQKWKFVIYLLVLYLKFIEWLLKLSTQSLRKKKQILG